MSRTKHTKLTPWLPCLALFFSTAASPQAASAPAPPAVLVELFTSEGCSSCPPADRLLMDLDRKQPVAGATVVVLSEHVDYWNSLGWRDPFSSRFWSERQQDYAAQFNLESVYTPQIVVDGSRQFVGSDNRALRSAIEDSAKSPHLSIGISRLVREQEHLNLEYAVPAADHASLYAVLADDSDRSSVQRGENEGRVLEHVAVARSLVKVADLGPAPLDGSLSIAVPPDAAGRRLRVVLFAKDRRNGRIVGVAARGL